MIASAKRSEYPIEALAVRAFTVPTNDPVESDGTLEWRSTTLVYVEVQAGGMTGMGYTYADAGTARLIDGLLRDVVIGKDATETAARWNEMRAAVRNNGRGGISAMAISAVDIALWDLKAKIAGSPVATMLGVARENVPVYGSGGFTSYGVRELSAQLSGWVSSDGIPRVKMKVGREPDEDSQRVAAARKAIGTEAELFVDANGAYAAKQAIALAQQFGESGVSWFEEPVDHDDLRGNCRVRDGVPAGMEISNGEYGYTLPEFEEIIDASAADVLQADVTRCGGYTGLLAVDALCQARNIPLSTHCAPYVTLPGAAACKSLRHLEYFYDHVRIEQMFFDGVSAPVDGALRVDLARPGIGLELKHADVARYAA
ncbi:MAG TPA: enolase C-terminal domain-like protein [Candidatus Rubrimentiphilum sp.]|nr:enolase C-terminal domain-like protein [Candidatus Rubrimentiphilum sp.]